MSKNEEFEEVLRFWFSSQQTGDPAAMASQMEWWFRGGADSEIIERFSVLFTRATKGELDNWSQSPRSRLALIVVLDQFSRTIHRGTAQAFAQDPKALRLALEGIEVGHYTALKTPWGKTFFFMPLGHSEELANLDRAVNLAEELVKDAPQEHRGMLEFSANQARGHRDVIARFGRHPHRNEILERQSTAEELEYLATGQLVHTRRIPGP